MKKKLIATLIAFLAIVPAFAVLNEKDLAHTLAVLRQELQMAKAEMQKSQVFISANTKATHERLVRLIQKTVLERKYHTDLYSAPQEENMRDSWQITLDGLAPGKYTVTVTACNVWDALGDTQTVEVSF